MKNFLSQLHADLRSSLKSRRGATHHPDHVPRGTHKEYPRMPQITLPKPEPISATLQETLEHRSSSMTGDATRSLLQQEIGTLLGLGVGKRPEKLNRNYPSGGALYPVETYLISTALESESPAAYHYNPSTHTLERLVSLPHDFDLKSIAPHPESLALSSLIVFTSVWSRSSAKYGDLAYLHAHLEAGHMSENILLVATALDIHARPYAGFQDADIVEILDLDSDEEQPLHSVTLCKP